MRDIIVVCMTYLSVMAGQAVVVPVPSNQAHQWTDRCEPIRFRPSWLPSPCEYFGGWTKILYFMTRV